MKLHVGDVAESGDPDRRLELRATSLATDDIARLHDFGRRLLAATDLPSALDEVLSAAISVLNADFGHIQLCDPESRSLTIATQHGLAPARLDHLTREPAATASCAAALKCRARVVVEDTLTHPLFQPYGEVAAAVGYRAVQSTPLVSHNGDVLGVIATHFRQPHRFSARDLSLLDLYAMHASAFIERRQAEAALGASEERFRSLVRSLPAAVYTCDIDGRITLFNESAAALWGRRPELHVDQWCGSFKIYQLDGSPVALPECPMALALREGQTVRGKEVIIERPDGTRRHVIPYPELLYDASGTVVGAVNMLVDITEHHVAQQALRVSQDRFRRRFELGLIGMAVTSSLGGIVEVNDELCRILGYQRQELLQKTWPELTHPHDLDADLVEHARALSGEIDGYSIDKRFIRKDGQTVDSIMAARCQRRADGSVDYFVGLVQDITDRKRAEAKTVALKNALAAELAAMTRLHDFSTRLLAERDLQPLLEEVLDAIVTLLGADLGLLQLYNRDTQMLTAVACRGFASEFLEDFREVAPEGDTSCSRALRGHQRVIVEDAETDPAFVRYRAAALSAGFRAAQSTPMFSRLGEPLGVISTYWRRPHRPTDDLLRMTDLYARQAAEMIESKQSEIAFRSYQGRLQELTTRLIEAQELQSKHLARELHDVFSQRLAAIGMELEQLATAPQQSWRKVRSRLLMLTGGVGRLADSIHDISRQMHPAILDDLGLIPAIRSECLAFSERYGIVTEFTSHNVPSTIREDLALCLYRVVQESLRNVAKHAGLPWASVQIHADARQLVLTIEDAGVGIDPASVKGKRGLGLVSMEERLRIVGGTLSIQSQQGCGTRVEACVPLAP